MLAALAVVPLLFAPQGPVGPSVPEPRATFDYPADPSDAMFAPFVDAAGAPQRVTTRSAGVADLDGDGNLDAWFLAGPGPRAGELAIGRAHAADLGRFVPIGAVSGGGFRDAVTFHRAGAADLVVVVDPLSTVPQMVFYQPGTPDPRSGTLLVQPLTTPVGPDAIGIDACDPDGDGHDDLLILRELRSASSVIGSELVRLHHGVGVGGYQLLSVATLTLPVAVDRVEAADLDHDGVADAVLHVPGLGVVAVTLDAVGNAAVHSFLPLVAGALVDLEVGDVDADGDDDWVAVLADGCVVARSQGATAAFDVLSRPAVVAPLAGARLADANGDGALDLVAIPSTGGVLAVFGFDASLGRFGNFELRVPGAVPELLIGAGIAGVCGITADLDRDGDEDLLLQLPSGDRWLALHGATIDLAPIGIDAVTIGMPSSAGFVAQRFTIDVPDAFFAAGYTDLEVGVFLRDPVTGESVYWDREIVQPDPITRRTVIQVQAMLDPLFRSWLWTGQITRHPQTGEITTFGETVITVHAKSGPRRARSKLLRWDGTGDPHSSAVGVRWRIVAAPPLPKNDAQLLPWD